MWEAGSRWATYPFMRNNEETPLLYMYFKLKQCFLRKTMSPNHLPLSATLKIMVLSNGDHLSNNILWAEMVIGRNGYGPKW